MRLFSFLVVTLLLMAGPAWGELVINEYQSSNETVIMDEVGDYPDWIELYNSGDESISLGGFCLSDDPEEPLKWTFPDIELPAGEFLLVFASGKGDENWPNCWQTVIDQGATWRYKIWTGQPPADWTDLEYDDSSWLQGPSGFGNSDGDDATEIPPVISCHLRTTFNLSSDDGMVTIYLNVDYDDAFIAYLNGVEIARANLGEPGDPVSWDDPADSAVEAQMYQGGLPELFIIEVTQGLLEAGDNQLAIEVHNTISSSDMTLIPFFTLGLGSEGICDGDGPAEILLPFIPHLHCNFKLSSTGEPLLLSDDTGTVLDLVENTALPMDISRGRFPDGGDQWRLFTEPTPDASNDDAIPYEGIATRPVFLMQPGFYPLPVEVQLAVAPPPAQTFYTLDGSVPGEAGIGESLLYSTPIPVDTTTVIRARTLLAGHISSTIATSTYFIDEDIDLPVVSITSDPDNFWDYETGILAMGPNADPNFPYYGANFYEDWERPVHMEYFDRNGQRRFNLDADTRVHGGSSRANPQKSLAILARDEYGVDHIEYPIFRTRDLTSYKRVILRNNGQDFAGAHCRDGLASRIVGDADLERMAYEPIVLFLNGMYWGLEGLREKLDKYFMYYHYGIDPDSIIAVEGRYSAIYYTADEWNALIDFIESEDLSIPANYEIIKGMMEVENFALYNVHEIFMGNLDWPNHNIKRWRPYADGGRWRWYFFDLDNSQGEPLGPDYNYLRNAIYDDGWPPGWSTIVMRGMLESPEFIELFANTWADELNSRLKPERTLSILDQVSGEIAGEIPRHRLRWDLNPTSWDSRIETIRNFYDERPAYALSQLMTEFGLSGTWNLSLDISPPGSGGITLTSLTVDSTWNGDYFDGIGVPLTATAGEGFVFAGWSDQDLPQQAEIILPPGIDRQVTAIFTVNLSSPVVINEINYNSADGFDPGDWVELNNPGSNPFDISGWEFKDGDDLHSFIIPPGSVIPPWGYLVLVDDPDDFSILFPEVTNMVGPLGFGFSGAGELLRLYDGSGNLIDNVTYDDSPPWPPEADGQGPTLELVDAITDNTLPVNWAASTDHGTPGRLNSCSDPVAVDDPETIPVALELRHPFPNPFNPATSIGFSLPRAGEARLDIFDISGRLVTTPLHERLPAGPHQVTWQAGTQASGVYFARLVFAGESRTRRLLLLK